MLKSHNIFTCLLAALILMQSSAFADEFRHERDEHRHEYRAERHYMHPHELEVWRGGRWFHGSHDGRRGWWWFAGGIWYLYPQPVYPYPDPYLPPGVIVQQAPVVVQQAPVMVEKAPAPATVEQAPVTTAPAAPAAPQYWYYCASPAGYYPTVPQCPGGWQKVLAK